MQYMTGVSADSRSYTKLAKIKHPNRMFLKAYIPDLGEEVVVSSLCWERGNISVIYPARQESGNIKLASADTKDGNILLRQTGMKDSEGVGIYEGDVIDGKYAVEFLNEKAMFVAKSLETGNEIPLYNFQKEIKITGNIFKNGK